MKNIIILSLLLLSTVSFAKGTMSADEIIDRGNYVEVIMPHLYGCASNTGCYGGAGEYFFKPHYSARKICKELGYNGLVKGSKLAEKKYVGSVYSIINYNLLERRGPPGAPEVRVRKIITFIECKK